MSFRRTLAQLFSVAGLTFSLYQNHTSLTKAASDHDRFEILRRALEPFRETESSLRERWCNFLGSLQNSSCFGCRLREENPALPEYKKMPSRAWPVYQVCSNIQFT
jgi:hypothetical protein